jgi:hypothetical protein
MRVASGGLVWSNPLVGGSHPVAGVSRLPVCWGQTGKVGGEEDERA